MRLLGPLGLWLLAATIAAQDEAAPPPRNPPEHHHPCVPELRRHCADAEAISERQCRAMLPLEANCTDAHIVRYRAENCAQWEKDGGLIDIHSFGGVGDGVGDNLEAIRRAVNATRACGGSVKFPTGRYNVSVIVLKGAEFSLWGGGRKCATYPRFA